MEAIILAGGKGTRLRDCLPAGLPKPLAPVAGRPFLEILLQQLDHQGFQRVVLSVGYGATQIQSYFGQHFGRLSLVYIREESPLGTGGALRLAMTASQTEHIYVFNGDTWLDLDISKVEQQWQHNRQPVIIGRQVMDSRRYGTLVIRDGKVIGLAEKTRSGKALINSGCYVFHQGQLDSRKVGSAFSLEQDFLAHTLAKSPFDLFISNGSFIDIGTPEDYQRANRLWGNTDENNGNEEVL